MYQTPFLDFHTGGQGMRLLPGPFPAAVGESMAEVASSFVAEYDWLRKVACSEPRGHSDLVCAFVVPASASDAAFGLLFADAGGYIDGCGEATMGAASLACEHPALFGAASGHAPSSDGSSLPLSVDTVGGLVRASVSRSGGRVLSVGIVLSAGVLAVDRVIELPDATTITVSVCVGGGNCYLIAPLPDLHVSLQDVSMPRLVEYAGRVRRAASDQLRDVLLGIGAVRFEMVQLVSEVDAAGVGQNVVVWGDRSVDRAPCGTGTAARLALLEAKGEVPSGGVLVHEGILGTQFRGEIIAGQGPLDLAVRVTGSSSLTMHGDLVVDPHDPVADGYMVEL